MKSLITCAAQLRCTGALIAAFLPVILCGCGGRHADDKRDVICTASIEPGVVINVTGNINKTVPIEQTTATLTDGNYTEMLQADPAPEGAEASLPRISFRGAFERAGTYMVTISHPGDATVTKTITVTKGVCHVDTQTVNINLSAP